MNQTRNMHTASTFYMRTAAPGPGCWGGGGVTLDFKWQGWPNKAKNQNRRAPLSGIPRASSKTPKKSLNQKLTPQKNTMPNFWALQISRKENKNFVAGICEHFYQSSDYNRIA